MSILILLLIIIFFALYIWWMDIRSKKEEQLAKEAKENNLKEQAIEKAKEFENTRINHRIDALNVADSVLKFFHSINRESAIILFLDESNVCMHVDIYFGDNMSVEIPNNELMENVLNYEAKKLIIMHNHPNERFVPSEKDILHAANLYSFLADEDVDLVDDIVWCLGGSKSVLNTTRFKQLIKKY